MKFSAVDELVTRGNNGGLEVALEGLDGLDLGAKTGPWIL